METKFTRGEWITHYDGIFCNGILIARKTGREKTLVEAGANLNLMASAPEMYKFLDDLANGRGTDYPIEKLLLKARGEL